MLKSSIADIYCCKYLKMKFKMMIYLQKKSLNMQNVVIPVKCVFDKNEDSGKAPNVCEKPRLTSFN